MLAVWIYATTLTRFDLAFDLHFVFLSLAVRVHAWTTAVRIHGSPTACFDVGFDFHVDSPIQNLAVRIHTYATACLDFGFDLHRGSPIASINRCHPSDPLRRF